MSEEQITNTNVVVETKTKSNRGRKPKYVDENARKMAKREQNRTYRERKRNELIALRRLAAEINKNNNSCESSENNSENNSETESTPSA